MNAIALTDTQRLILAHAIEHTGGRIEWFPENIKGGARQKVLDGLTNRGLVTHVDDAIAVANEGYDALGLPRPSTTEAAPEPCESAAGEVDSDAEGTACEGATAPSESQVESAPAEPAVEPVVARTPRTRADSKQAQVIELLRRPEGATIQQVCDLTSWQAHTVRGTFAGAFKKRLGLNVISHKSDDGARVYRIE